MKERDEKERNWSRSFTRKRPQKMVEPSYFPRPLLSGESSADYTIVMSFRKRFLERTKN